ncbi:hypothetical protein ACLRGF_07575 [Mycetocola zhadangensis]|uniref:hypothetical protein n=1 Tax=Mycetocola zhadangensis TaxID=1164595 RepID=UPI003A4DB3C7
MSDTRTHVMALAALGAGLVHLAIGAGTPVVLAVAICAFGLGELAWGVVVLARGQALIPTLMLAGSIAPVALWGIFAAVRASGGAGELTDVLPLGPLAAGSILNLTVALCLAWDRRARKSGQRAEGAAPHRDRPGRYLLGMLLGAMAVAGIVTPALAATNAGTYAVPHGEHAPATDQLDLPAHGSHSGH